MSRFILAGLFALSWNASALECAAPAVLKQADGPGNTLHSWCETGGKREGVYEVFAMEGGQQLHAEFKNGKLDGKFRRFQNGKLITEGTFRDGKMEGEWTRYRQDGSKLDHGMWKDDHPVGQWGAIEFDASGKKIEKIADHNSRLDVGIARSKASNSGDTVFFALGGERRLWRPFGWLQIDLTARIYKEKLPEKNDGVMSFQAGLAFDLLRSLTNPFNIYFRLGPNLPQMKHPHMFGSVGVRYLPDSNNHWGGVFLELIDVAYGGDLYDQQNNCGPGPGPCMKNDKINSDTLILGTMYSF
jgi:hypothetical protein